MTFDAIAQQLKNDFMHRASNDYSCAVCGSVSHPLAFHVLQRSYSQGTTTPKGFVAMSMSMGAVRGAFPVCNRCAPACSSCGLPIATEQALEFGNSLGANTGNGVCRQHIHFGEFFKALFKKAFHLGRFKSQPHSNSR